jgi:TRAP-type mannitol/chloroaromatic compound transport system substrate-binding protein
MNRRKFLAGGAAASAAAVTQAVAHAPSHPNNRWRFATSFP